MNWSSAEIVFWIATGLCLVAELAIIRAMIRHPAGPPTSSMAGSSRRMEIMWAVIPALALGFVLSATWRAIH